MSDTWVAPAEIPLQPFDAEKPDLAKIFSDDVLRAQVRRDAAYFALRFRDTIRDANLVMNSDPVIFLIDNDVIRNLIDSGPDKPVNERRALSIFNNPNFRYAIPIGAFQELLVWLESEFRTNLFLPANVSITEKRKDALKYLARAVGVSPDNPNEYLLIKDISSAIAQRDLIATELLRFLERSNFMGVYSEVDDSVMEISRQLIESGERHGDNTHRDQRDLYDAQNLAVVLKSRSHSTHDRELSSYLLVTQTSMLLRLPRSIDKNLSHNLAERLARILGTSKFHSNFPVLAPKGVFGVEELRSSGRLTAETFQWLGKIQRTFTDIALAISETGPQHSLLSPESKQQRAEVVDRLFNQVADLANDRLFAILDKDLRGSFPQVYASIDRQYRTLVDPPEIEIAAARKQALDASKSFLRKLAQLTQRLATISPTNYELQRLAHPSGVFEHLSVISHDPDDPVLRGELYLDDMYSETRPLGYSFRWRTTCSEKHFFESLQGIFVIAKDQWGTTSAPTLKVSTFLDEEDGPAEALVIFTSAGPFLVPLQDALILATQGDQIASEIRKAIRAIEVDKKIDIQAIRVQTRFGEFQLDVANDEDGVREVFVISRFNIGEQIAYLCKSTAVVPTITDRLNGVLQDVTGKFERYTRMADKQSAAPILDKVAI